MSRRSKDEPNPIQGDHECKEFPGEQKTGAGLEICRDDMIDTYLYVLNHSCQRIHLETFFFFAGGLVGLAVAGTTSAVIIPGGLAFSSIFSLTSPRSATVTGPVREPFSASSWTVRTSSGRGAEVMVYREARAVESNEDESLTWTVLQTVEGRDVHAAKFRCDPDVLMGNGTSSR